MKKQAAPDLQEELEKLTRRGITVESGRLKEDMCGQFGDPDEWIREYAVNAFDAQARSCYITGYEDHETTTIAVEDDGHGMDRDGVLDFATIYRSVKPGRDQRIPVGTHGIGKLSVAAIPGQCGFKMITSNGRESWMLEAGSLLSDQPIVISPADPSKARGTRFEVTFERSRSLESVLVNLASILKKYVRFLPIRVFVCRLAGPDGGPFDAAHMIYNNEGAGGFTSDQFGRIYSFHEQDMAYQVALGIGPAVHEVYQNWVLVSDRYNLLSLDDSRDWRIPHLTIRVESPHFELPFGRHRLLNEEALRPVMCKLRQEILPRYLGELLGVYGQGELAQYQVSPVEVEDLATALMARDHTEGRPWCRAPVFALLNGPRLSLDELREMVQGRGVLYLEGREEFGIDYSAVDGPVLANRQPAGALELIAALFKEVLVSLDNEDLVFEADGDQGPELSDAERTFEKYLGFHPEVIRRNWGEKNLNSEPGSGGTFQITPEDLERLKGTLDDIVRSGHDLGSIRWRVNYLVNRDGRTPCASRLFLYKKATVVLNLHHPLVKKLVRLSHKSPNLASHWALAICLTAGSRILPQLAPETREFALMLDAIGKCGRLDSPLPVQLTLEDAGHRKKWEDFKREARDQRRWLH